MGRPLNAYNQQIKIKKKNRNSVCCGGAEPCSGAQNGTAGACTHAVTRHGAAATTASSSPSRALPVRGCTLNLSLPPVCLPALEPQKKLSLSPAPRMGWRQGCFLSLPTAAWWLLPTCPGVAVLSCPSLAARELGGATRCARDSEHEPKRCWSEDGSGAASKR